MTHFIEPPSHEPPSHEPPSHEPPSHEPMLHSRAELLAGGVTDYRLRRALVAGQLIAVTPGVYRRADFRSVDPGAIHRAAVRAVLIPSAAPAVGSHLSAAVVHGIRLPCGIPVSVHLTRAPPAKSRAGVRISVHRGTLEPGDVVGLDGLAVTSIPRTVVDCLLILSPAEATALATVALGDGWVTEKELVVQLRRRARTPGVRAAAGAVAAASADPGATA